MKLSLRPLSLAAAAALVAACAPPIDDSDNGAADLTGTTSAERAIHFEGQVFVAADASDDAVKIAIAREVKTAIGALRQPMVSIDDRGSLHNLDPAKWTKKVLTLKDPANPAQTSQVMRVTYKYDDRAVVTNQLASRSSVDFVMLQGDYGQHDQPLKTDCTDDPTTDTDSLWYHYQPQNAACTTRVQNELAAIASEQQKNGNAPDVVGPAEAHRWFMPVTAKLDAPQLPGKAFSPEYDRLFGLGTNKDKLIVYAFFGVDSDENNPDDVLAQEAVRFLREMQSKLPNIRVTNTNPGAMLLDIYVDGKKLDGVTYDKMWSWVLDQTSYPPEVGTDAGKIADLRKQVIGKLAERWIYWDLPIRVNDKDLMVEVRTFYDYEDGSPDARQHAQWRYLEAFWYGDVFLYNGHSHFGHGPLEPNLYSAQNFNDRYQIMMVNSCISYNYYHEDFLAYKPGGSKNLDMVVNGLPSYVWGGGVATARLLTQLLDGTQKSYVDILNGQRLDTPWGETGYDPMRIVDGELDNVYDKSKTPITFTVKPPLY